MQRICAHKRGSLVTFACQSACCKCSWPLKWKHYSPQNIRSFEQQNWVNFLNVNVRKIFLSFLATMLRRPCLATDLLICRWLEVDECALNTHPFIGATLSAFRPYWPTQWLVSLWPKFFKRWLDNAIHQINLHAVDSFTGFPNTYSLNSDLSSG